MVARVFGFRVLPTIFLVLALVQRFFDILLNYSKNLCLFYGAGSGSGRKFKESLKFSQIFKESLKFLNSNSILSYILFIHV